MPGWSNTNTNLSKPKYLKATDKHNDNANVYAVNVAQQSLANSANYVYHGSHQGWVKIIPEYTDVHGNKRHKSETLVVISAVDKAGITGVANTVLTGSCNVSNGNVTIAANVTASLIAANSFLIFSANAIPLLSNNDVILVANAGPFAVNVFSALNVAVNIAPNFTLAGQKVWFAPGTSKGNTSITGSSVGLGGLANSRFFHELKVGDVIQVGNFGATPVTGVKILAINPNTGLGEWALTNTTFASVSANQSMYVGDQPWFPAA
jgi:hypothetical protein